MLMHGVCIDVQGGALALVLEMVNGATLGMLFGGAEDPAAAGHMPATEPAAHATERQRPGVSKHVRTMFPHVAAVVDHSNESA